MAAHILAFARRSEANRRRLAGLSRVLVHAFPHARPEAVVLLDIGRREITSYLGKEIEAARQRLAGYDYLLAVDVRPLLTGLGFDWGDRRLGDLAPPRKSMRINKQGRTLRITTTMLIEGSCGIRRPLGDPKVMMKYLRNGQDTRLRHRLEADVRSLFTLYRYGHLHGAVRLRWGFLDEMIPVPWAHHDELFLRNLLERAGEQGRELEGVIGSAPGWTDPWARVRRARVVSNLGRRCLLLDETGLSFDSADLQPVREVEP